VGYNDRLVTIVGHGQLETFDNIAQYSTLDLANYITKNFKDAKMVELVVCNCGKSFDGSIPFAQKLANLLEGVPVKAAIDRVNAVDVPIPGIPFVRNPDIPKTFLFHGEGWQWFYQKKN